jgi:hypothetical protein
MNTQYVCDFVFEEAWRAVIAITRKNGIEETPINMDHCQMQNFAKIMKRLEDRRESIVAGSATILSRRVILRLPVFRWKEAHDAGSEFLRAR